MKTTVTALLACAFAGSLFAESTPHNRDVIERSGVRGGFVAHVGCADGTLTAALRNSDAYVVHGIDTDDAKVQQARRPFLAAELGRTVSAATFDG